MKNFLFLFVTGIFFYSCTPNTVPEISALYLSKSLNVVFSDVLTLRVTATDNEDRSFIHGLLPEENLQELEVR